MSISITSVQVRRVGALALTALVAFALAAVFAARADAASGIYYTAGDNIGYADLDGSNSDPAFIIRPSGSNIATIATNQTHVYWTQNQFGGATGGGVYRANLDGTDPVRLIDINNAEAVALDGQYMYYSGRNPTPIGRANLDGSSPNANFVTGIIQGFASAIAVNGTHIYWSRTAIGGSGAIGRANIDGTGVNNSFITTPASGISFPTPWGVAIDANYVYWANWDGGRPVGSLGRANLDGSNKIRDFIASISTPSGVAVDSDYIYWGALNDDSYGRANIDGSLPNSEFIFTPTSSFPTGISVLVEPRSTSTSLTCDPTDPSVGEAASCTATVTDDDAGDAVVPSGSVAFSATGGGAFDPAASCSLTPVDASSASCSVDYAPAATGSDTVTSDYGGDAGHSTSSDDVALSVTHATTTTAVVCSPEDPVVDETTTCTATVTGAGGVSPTGDVDFGATGTGTFDPSPATCTLAAAGAGGASCSVDYTPSASGNETVTADYDGDAGHLASDGEFALDVGLAASSTAVACDPTDPIMNEATTCTATVTDSGGAGSDPAGSVSFSATGAGGEFDPTSCTLAPAGDDSASCSVDYTPTVFGGDTVTAEYGGGSGHASSTGETTLDVGRPATTTTVACNPTQLVAEDDTTTCTATVTASVGDPTGTVDFGSSSVGDFVPDPATCTLEPAGAGSASCAVEYTPGYPGSETITADYLGDSVNAPSSGDATLQVSPAPHPANGYLECIPDRLPSTTATTCTMTVIDAFPTEQEQTAPTGTVTFTSDSPGAFSPVTCTLAPATNDSSTCSVSYTPSDVGIQIIRAVYSADDEDHRSGAQSIVTLTVMNPPAPPAPPPVLAPPITPALPAPAPAAPQRFALGKLIKVKRTGRAKLRVRVPGRGRLTVRGAKVRNAGRRTARGGMVRLTIRAKGKALRTLKRKGRVNVRVRVVFNPAAAGANRSRSRSVRLVMTKKKKAGSRRGRGSAGSSGQGL